MWAEPEFAARFGYLKKPEDHIYCAHCDKIYHYTSKVWPKCEICDRSVSFTINVLKHRQTDPDQMAYTQFVLEQLSKPKRLAALEALLEGRDNDHT